MRTRSLSIFLLTGISLVLASCSKTTVRYTTHAINELDDVRYSVVYVIHADANYLYHEQGMPRQADIEAMKDAFAFAEKATSGEVFVFHQRPEKKQFLVFPQKDRDFFYFRNGKLIDHQKYSPSTGGFDREAELYREMSKAGEASPSAFLYFGHEIPNHPSISYHGSMHGKRFDTEVFAESLSLFNKKIDLVLVSTCNNGNPFMISKLEGHADVVIASPQNLHLSHLESERLELLESRPDIPIIAVADSIAAHSFKALSDRTLTAVTVSVYDLNELKMDLNGFNSRYQSYLNELPLASSYKENVDCRKIGFFDESLFAEGLKSYYRAPAFGRMAKVDSHSGWGCKE